MAYSIVKFKNRLKSLIAEHKSERQFAKSIGMSQSAIRIMTVRGEQGPTLSKIYNLMDRLGEEKTLWLITGHLPSEKPNEEPTPADEVINEFRAWVKFECGDVPDLDKLLSYYLDQVKKAIKETKKIE